MYPGSVPAGPQAVSLRLEPCDLVPSGAELRVEAAASIAGLTAELEARLGLAGATWEIWDTDFEAWYGPMTMGDIGAVARVRLRGGSRASRVPPAAAVAPAIENPAGNAAAAHPHGKIPEPESSTQGCAGKPVPNPGEPESEPHQPEPQPPPAQATMAPAYMYRGSAPAGAHAFSLRLEPCELVPSGAELRVEAVSIAGLTAELEARLGLAGATWEIWEADFE
eukprot:COSAG04_NODE_6054_length_1421_cov_1.170953_2_plen_222_part_01